MDQYSRRGIPTLYDLCIEKLKVVYKCRRVHSTNKNFRVLPNNVLCDFFMKFYNDVGVSFLVAEFSDLVILYRLLRVRGKETFLLNAFQTIFNRKETLPNCLLLMYHNLIQQPDTVPDLNLIDVGLRVGQFLNDGGWYQYSIQMVHEAEILLNNGGVSSKAELVKLLECCRLKLLGQSLFCRISDAAKTYEKSKRVIAKLEEFNSQNLFPSIYCAISIYHFVLSNFSESYIWAIKALSMLPKVRNERLIIDILRQASKVCVIKRKFIQAGLLIRLAKSLGDSIDVKNQYPLTYSHILSDFGFYLLNSDSLEYSVHVYEQALECRRGVFKRNNLHLALAYEDLAYSLYVTEYIVGNFTSAHRHAEEAVNMMKEVLPRDHLLLASAKRVQALILEEMALDQHPETPFHKERLAKAKELHLSALKMSQEIFGERNVQTAKHYGNLGRLYQSMRLYEESEKLHRKSISIKEELLGPNDYEVGLSVGHLASLYNHHMKKYKEAEKLYFRSLEINIRLFGLAYSALEYDYRGLINVYTKLGDPKKMLFFTEQLREWEALRDKIEPYIDSEPLMPLDTIVERFFAIGENERQLQQERAKLAEQVCRL